MRIVFRLLLLGAFLLWQNFSIRVDVCSIPCADLPKSFEGMKILEISDLHGRDLKQLPEKISEAQPDLICITGDLFGSPEEWEGVLPLLPEICTIAPTYYVTGNHEWQVPDLKGKLRQMETLGICVLENEYQVLERQGQKLILAGVHDPCGPYDQKSPAAFVEEIRQQEGDAFVVMLAHRNNKLSMWAELGVDLVLSGHCHGGVIRLPFVGGVFGPGTELFPDYDSGLYEEDGTLMYVSRGLGYSRFKLRLFNRPHLPVLILKGK